MLFDKLISEKWLINSTVCGIEIIWHDDSVSYVYTILKKNKEQLSVVQKGVAENINELPSVILKNKIPLILILNGKGIITKKIKTNNENEINQTDFVTQNLPAFNSDDFFCQSNSKDNTVFCSIIRIEQIKKCISDFETHKYEIADLLLGPTCICSIIPLLSKNKILTAVNEIEIDQETLSEIKNINLEKNKTNTTSLAGIDIPDNNLVGFAAAFGYLTGQNNYINHRELPIKQRHAEKQKIKLIAYSLVGLTFIICLMNFFTFSHFFSRGKELQTELEVYEGKYEKINDLLKSYEKKKSLLDKAGISELNSVSEIADKISKTIPKELVLNEFLINPPLNNEEEPDSLKGFEKDVLIVKGNCRKSLLVNEWVNILKSQDFISNVNLEVFRFNNEGNLPNFELKIIIE